GERLTPAGGLREGEPDPQRRGALLLRDGVADDGSARDGHLQWLSGDAVLDAEEARAGARPVLDVGGADRGAPPARAHQGSADHDPGAAWREIQEAQV